MAEETTDLQKLVVSLEARLQNFDRQMKKLSTQTDKNLAGVEKRFAKADRAIAGFGANAKASLSSLGSNLFAGLNPASLVASLGGAGIAAFAKNAVTSLGNIKDQAEQAGVSIKEMQELTFAALSEGFGAGDIVGIFQKLNKELADARIGGGQLAEILAANNVPLTDQNGVLRSNKDLFFDIVDLIKNAKDATDRQLISQLAMGRSAGELAPLFKLGSAGLREMAKAADAAGFIVEDKLVNSADEFIDNWTRVAGTFTKLWQAAAGGALLQFEDVLNKAVAIDDFLRERTGAGLIEKPLADIVDPLGKAERDGIEKRNNALAQQQKLEEDLLELLKEREIIRQQEQPLDQLGQRRLDILNDEIGRYDRLIKAHKAFMEQLRASTTVLPNLGTQPGLSSPQVRETIVGTDADKKAAADAAKADETAARKAAANKLALAHATDTLFIAVQREIAAKEMEAQAQGRSVYEMERARKEMELLARLEDEHRQYGGAVTADELANVKLLADAWGNVNQEMSDNQQALAELQEVGDTVFGGLEDALGKFIDTGKLDVKGMVASIIKDLAKLSIRNLLGSIQNGSGGSGSGGVMGWLANLIPGAGGRGRTVAPSQQGSAVPQLIKAFSPGAGLSAGTPMGRMAAGGKFSGVKGQVWDYFAAKGLQPHQIAGIMGNVQAESAFNPNAVGDGGDAFGLFQWNNRRPDLFKHAGTNKPDTQQQLDFAWHELQTSERGAMKRLMASKDVAGATKAFAGFERPKGFSFDNPQAMAGWQERITAAQQMMAQSSKGLSTSLSKVTAAAGTSAADFSGSFGPALQSVIGAVGGEGGGAGGFLSILQPLLSLIPGLAKGGPVRKGQPYIVGEKRPELFVPGEPGHIVPHVPRLTMPRAAMAVSPFANTRQRVDVNIRADASPLLLIETDRRASSIASRGDGRTLRTADRQAPGRMAQFEKLGT